MNSNFAQNIVSIYGEEGEKWLGALPNIEDQLARKHNLFSLKPISDMSFNYVAKGYQNNKPIILKISFNVEDISKEVQALRFLSKYGGVPIIASDYNAIIMECAVPGITFEQYFKNKHSEETEVFCTITQKLHHASIPSNHRFVHIKKLLKKLDQNVHIPVEILLKARFLRDELLKSTVKEVFLHGDLHHHNILQHNDGWMIIDPKGYIGDFAFDLAAYLYNPISSLLKLENAKNIIMNRIKTCSHRLNIEQKRIKNWLYVKCVLCWIWNLEDNLDSTYWEKYMDLLSYCE